MKIMNALLILLVLVSVAWGGESIKEVDIGTVGVTTNEKAQCTLTTEYSMNTDDDGYTHKVKYPTEVTIKIKCKAKEDHVL